MFKNLIKAMCAVLCVVLLIFSSACSNKKEEGSGDTTRLKMILVGDKPVIFDEIWGKVNEMLKEDLNATVQIEYISYSNMNQKYSLLFTGDDKFDLVFSASWLDYIGNASKNSYMEITDDMLKNYAPKTYASINEQALNDAKVNGKVYMVPNTADEYSTTVVMIRGDLRKKHNLDPLETLDDFYGYLKTLADEEAEIVPYVDLSFGSLLWRDYANGFSYVTTGLESSEITFDPRSERFVGPVFDQPYVDVVDITRKMVDDGILPKDIVANKQVGSMFEQGKAGSYLHNLETTAAKKRALMDAHPEWDLEIYDFSQGVPKVVNSYTANGISLNRNTANIEKALGFLDLLRNDERYFNLTWYGIEGKHWERVGENGYTLLDGQLDQNEKYQPGCVWGWKNGDMLLDDANDTPERKEIFTRWQGETIPNPISGFTPDTSAIKNEMAAMTNVGQQYGAPLFTGMIEKNNIPEAIEVYRNQTKQAGYENVISALQNQYEKFLTEK